MPKYTEKLKGIIVVHMAAHKDHLFYLRCHGGMALALSFGLFGVYIYQLCNRLLT